MSNFYPDMQSVATALLTQFDQGGVFLSVQTPGGGPPYNPGPDTYVDTALPATVSGIDAKYLTNTLIQESDLQVTFPGGIVVPKSGDKVKIAGVTYSIVQIVGKPATGTVAAYTLIVRK